TGQANGQRTGQGGGGALRRRVVRSRREPVMGGDRRGDDDRTRRVAGDQVPGDLAGGQEDTFDVDFEHVGQVGQFHLGERDAGRGARVCEQRVDLAETVDGGLERF